MMEWRLVGLVYLWIGLLVDLWIGRKVLKIAVGITAWPYFYLSNCCYASEFKHTEKAENTDTAEKLPSYFPSPR